MPAAAKNGACKKERGEAPSGDAGELLSGLSLDAVLERANAVLSAPGASVPRSLTFGWQGIDFTVERESPVDDGPDLVSLDACLGYLPFSAENLAARRESISLIHSRWTLSEQPFQIRADGRVCFSQSRRADGLVDLSSLLQIVSQRVLALQEPLKRLRQLLIQTS